MLNKTGGSAFSKSSNKFAEKLRKLNSEAEEARADVLQPSAGGLFRCIHVYMLYEPHLTCCSQVQVGYSD